MCGVYLRMLISSCLWIELVYLDKFSTFMTSQIRCFICSKRQLSIFSEFGTHRVARSFCLMNEFRTKAAACHNYAWLPIHNLTRIYYIGSAIWQFMPPHSCRKHMRSVCIVHAAYRNKKKTTDAIVILFGLFWLRWVFILNFIFVWVFFSSILLSHCCWTG